MLQVTLGGMGHITQECRTESKDWDEGATSISGATIAAANAGDLLPFPTIVIGEDEEREYKCGESACLCLICTADTCKNVLRIAFQ